jgi:hypothetical protein
MKQPESRNCLDPIQRAVLAHGGVLLSPFAGPDEIKAWALDTGRATAEDYDADAAWHEYQKVLRSQRIETKRPLSYGRGGIR